MKILRSLVLGTKSWKLENEMQFCKPHIVHRRRSISVMEFASPELSSNDWASMVQYPTHQDLTVEGASQRITMQATDKGLACESLISSKPLLGQ